MLILVFMCILINIFFSVAGPRTPGQRSCPRGGITRPNPQDMFQNLVRSKKIEKQSDFVPGKVIVIKNYREKCTFKKLFSGSKTPLSTRIFKNDHLLFKPPLLMLVRKLLSKGLNKVQLNFKTFTRNSCK